jgi:hypothetical protein
MSLRLSDGFSQLQAFLFLEGRDAVGEQQIPHRHRQKTPISE